MKSDEMIVILLMHVLNANNATLMPMTLSKALEVAGGFTTVASPRVMISPRGMPTRQPFQACFFHKSFTFGFWFRHGSETGIHMQIIAHQSSLMTAEHFG